MGPVLVGITLAASIASSATFVINPGFVYTHGVSAFIHFGVSATSGVTLGLIIMSKGFRRYGTQTGALTLPHWIGARYDHAWMRTYFAILNLVLAITFVVLIIKGSALVMVATLGLGYTVSVFIVVGFVFSYILLGGTYAHAYTNAFQGALMTVVAILLVASGFHLLGDGIGPFLARLSAEDPNLAKILNPSSALYSTPWEVFVTPFIVGFSLVCQPHILMKPLYLKEDRDLVLCLVVAAVVGFVFASILIVGLFARIEIPLGTTSQDAVMAFYIAKTFSPMLGVFISVALIAAGMSTMDGILVSASTIAGNDLFLGVLGDRLMPNATEERRQKAALRASRNLLIVMGIASLVFVLNPPKYVGLFAQMGIYGLVAASVAPILVGVFSTRVVAKDAFMAAIIGPVIHFVHYGYVVVVLDQTINPAVTATEGMMASLLFLLGATALRKRSLAVA